MGRSMVGKIPGLSSSPSQPGITIFDISRLTYNYKLIGLISWDAGTPLTATAARANGYDMGVVLVLRNEAQLKSFAEHPAHHE